MTKTDTNSQHAELLILPNGQILVHNVTPEIAVVLSELDPENELMRRRVVQTLSPQSSHEAPAGN